MFNVRFFVKKKLKNNFFLNLFVFIKKSNFSGGSVVVSTNRKKSDGEFHEMCDRSEFYHMSDLEKSAALFIPPPGDEFDTRFLDSTSIASFEALSELEPLSKRPRTSERSKNF